MTRRTIVKVSCDRCGKEGTEQEIRRFDTAIGETSDPAGGPALIDYEPLDFCDECVPKTLAVLFATISHETARDFVEKLRKLRKG